MGRGGWSSVFGAPSDGCPWVGLGWVQAGADVGQGLLQQGALCLSLVMPLKYVVAPAGNNYSNTVTVEVRE